MAKIIECTRCYFLGKSFKVYATKDGRKLLDQHIKKEHP